MRSIRLYRTGSFANKPNRMCIWHRRGSKPDWQASIHQRDSPGNRCASDIQLELLETKKLHHHLSETSYLLNVGVESEMLVPVLTE